MDYFPLFFKLQDQPCLVVGAGETAVRKITLLLKAGARISIVARSFNSECLALAQKNNLPYQQRDFIAADVQGSRLVIAATNDRPTNQQIAAAANQQAIWINVVDDPELCSFIFPALIERTPLIAAISSGGASPVLARLLRAKIETVIPAAYGKLAELAERFRPAVKQQIKDPRQRRIFWENVLQGSIAESALAGQLEVASAAIEQLLQANATDAPKSGEVYLIGAGPGDPDLLTFRALRLLQQADVVVYDRLVSPGILELARRDSRKIYVGKERNNHSVPQESINDLLAKLALEGQRVARLKGGDPFIFGRGGEEIATLMAQGIQFQVVPGITAASGCASYSGIPLTHRDHAQSCLFVTGHLKDGSMDLDWAQLAAPRQTVVVYMGLVGLPLLCQQLIAHGAPADLPIALIEQGTTNQQRVFTGSLTTLPGKINALAVRAPTLLIIGTVVSLRPQLNWFQRESE